MKPFKIQLPFGLNENNIIVHIDNVASGRSCNCICPCCHSPLIAAKGTKNQHHFKHSTTIECAGGLESAIHMAAKQIILERQEIRLPEYTIATSIIDSQGKKHHESKTIVPKGRLISFDSVHEEKTLSDIKADILAIKSNEQLIIEIFYRHKVDGQKIEKIKEINTSAIEIDLSDLTPEDVQNWESFWLRINDPSRIQWLYNAKAQIHLSQLKNQLKETVDILERGYEQEKIKRQQREPIEKRQLIEALEELKHVTNKDYIAQLTKEAENNLVWRIHSNELQLILNELPDFLNLDLPNSDWIYGCDRRVWQIAVYNKFICKNNKPYFSVKQVDDWLQIACGFKVPSCAKTIGKLGRRYPELVPQEVLDNMPSSWTTLRAYFSYLERLGQLIYSGNDRRHRGSCWFEVYTGDFKPYAPYQSSIEKVSIAHGYQV